MLLLAVLGVAASGAAQAPPAPKPAPPAPTKPGYVGDDTCMACHEPEAKRLALTLHGKAQNARTPSANVNQACETCHGPGKEHSETGDVTKIRVFTTMTPRDVSEVCLTCHNRGGHALWKGSMHDARNLSCTTCHSVHNPQSERSQLKTATISETCVTCHKTEVAKLQRFGHMPVREGKMQCTSCHDPHGSTNVRLLKVGTWVNELCTSCHAEKRGPFLWDHAPVREACNTCHDPHGSNNDRMLVAKLPMLCQRCHIGTRHPSTIYDGVQLAAGSNRLIGRGCVNCHAQIHGSNSPAGNAFLR
ncbi:MAG TPA: DmsE family decaheme c-type cytochrome [Vicinamibacterales bacterium]|nr:DmsE family decaheme c-type cytochrome [Vicinamibacterales bacterium]